jgi:hypothetical protein
MNFMFIVTSKVHENEHRDTSYIETFMGTLVQHKKHIVVLEAKCNIIRNMVLNLRKGD